MENWDVKITLYQLYVGLLLCDIRETEYGTGSVLWRLLMYG